MSCICFLLLIFAACNNKKTDTLHPDDCRPFKFGVFENPEHNYRIERYENSQVEYDLSNNTSYHFEVHWLYDCAYNLIFKHSTNDSDTFRLNYNDMMRIQMIELSDSSYTSVIEFKNESYKSEMIKMK